MLDKARNDGGGGGFETQYDITNRRCTIIPVVHSHVCSKYRYHNEEL